MATSNKTDLRRLTAILPLALVAIFLWSTTPAAAQQEPQKTNPPEVKPAEVKPAEVKPAEVKPAEVNPPEAKLKPKPLDPEEELRRDRESRIIAIMTDMIYDTCLARSMLEIDELRRVGGIDETSAKRLELAGKGAASHYAEKQAATDSEIFVRKIPPLVRVVNANGKLVELPIAKKEQDDEDEFNIDELDIATVYPRLELSLSDHSVNWNYKEKNSSSGWGRSGGLSQMKRNAIWVNALKKNTTPEHHKRIEQARQTRFRRSASDLCVALIAARVSLDEKQRDEVAKIIEEMVANETTLTENDFNTRGYGVIRKVFQGKKVDGFKEILTKPQWVVWQEQLALIESGNF